MIVHLSGASLALLSSSLSQRFPVMPYIVEFEVNLSKFKWANLNMWDCHGAVHLSYLLESLFYRLYFDVFCFFFFAFFAAAMLRFFVEVVAFFC